jgi:glycine/D-amino acid oxidase-like deaminating enzyme
MENTSLGSAPDARLSHDLSVDDGHGLVHNQRVSLTLSHEANDIGMKGFVGGAERLGIVAGQGLLEAPRGMVEAIKNESPGALLATAGESVAIGLVLRTVASKAAPIASLAGLAMGGLMVTKTGAQFYNAFAQGLNAKTNKDMEQASSAFGRAAGSLAIDSIIGFAGYKIGSALAFKGETIGNVGTAPKAVDLTVNAAARAVEPIDLASGAVVPRPSLRQVYLGPNDGLIKIDPSSSHMEPQIVLARQFEHDSTSAFAEVRQQSMPTHINKETDTVVVGAGFAGLSIADKLANSGIKTIVVDSGMVGGRTSQFAGGMVTRAGDPSFIELRETHGEDVLRNYIEGMSEAHQQVIARASKSDVDFVPGTSQQISYEENPDMKAEFDLLHRFDPNTAFVTGKEAQAIFAPAHSAMQFLGEGSVNPVKYSNQLARSLSVFENSPVVGLRVGKPNSGFPLSVLTADGGMINAKRVVFATGTADHMSQHLNSCVEGVQCFASIAKVDPQIRIAGNIFDTDGAVRASDGTIKNTDSDAPYNYFRRVNLPGQNGANDLVLFGAADRVLPHESAANDAPDLHSQLQTLFPGAKILDGKTWTGTIEESHDGMPIIAKHPSLPIFQIRGIGGSGLDSSQFTANELLKMIQGKPSILSSDRFSHLAAS